MFAAFGGPRCEATVYHSDGSAVSVQALHNAALNGDTITLPTGTFTWTTGVTISKAIKIQGDGSGRIIGQSRSNVAVGTGSKTFATKTGLNISSGNTLRIESMPLSNGTTDGRGTWMQGTVTSYSGTNLTMNVTTSGGSGTHDFWKIETIPATTINHGTDANTLFTLNESSAGSIELFGIRFTQFGDPAQSNTNGVVINTASNGQPVLIHDCWFSEPDSNHVAILSATNRGVIWNCSFDASPFALSSLAVQHKVAGATTSWTALSTFGAADTAGTSNLYIEDCDFHAYLNCGDNDDNARMVLRHCVFDNSGFGTHGADTSSWGQRHFEIYDSEFVFNSTNGDVLNINWWAFVRGGTFVVTDCIMPLIQSQDYGTKSSFNLTVMNLQRNAGPNPCWGVGTTNGALYHSPRQVGFGRVTGSGRDGEGRTNDSVTYVGDSEPIYIWNITGPAPIISTSDYGGSECSNPDRSSNYIKSGRDYFYGTAKPNYQKFVYPHPRRNIGPTPTPTATATPTATVTPSPTPAPTPRAPRALRATNVTADSLTANWSSVTEATGYRLDVATNDSFTNYVPGYRNLNVNNTTSRNITGLTANTFYYYRLRAYNSKGTSLNSNVIRAKTSQASQDNRHQQQPSQ